MRNWLVVLLLLLLWSCSKSSLVEPVDNTHYFPLAVGHTIIYEVDSVLYSPLFAGGRDTVRFEVKDAIIAVDEDLAGNTVYIIERVEREAGTLPWVNPTIGQRLLTNGRAEEVFENVRFVPLTFPLRVGAGWLSTQYLTNNPIYDFYADWNTIVRAVDQSDTVNGIVFDSVAVINHIDDESLTEWRYARYKYATNVGMVAMEQKYFKVETDSSAILFLPWPQKITNGFETTWRIKEL